MRQQNYSNHRAAEQRVPELTPRVCEQAWPAAKLTGHAAPALLEAPRQLLLEPHAACYWASDMVLNPGIIRDPESGRLHLLFRATGPCRHLQGEVEEPPFPIFLGYGWSDDDGANWRFDLSRPALAPRVGWKLEELYLKNASGERVLNHANGCIEDPRLSLIEGQCYLVAACRLFPPGAYWMRDDPHQQQPRWVRDGWPAGGAAARDNVTVNVLYRVDLKALAEGRYEQAFQYLTNLTDPERGEDRDCMLFPARHEVAGRAHFLCVHRPWNPAAYPEFAGCLRPSIAVSFAETFDALRLPHAGRYLLAEPLFDWEGDRIGASAPPLQLSGSEWLLPYHGKRDPEWGYAQSFMILEAPPGGLPVVKHRCSTPLLRPCERWEMPGRFKSPVCFVTGFIELGDKFLATYGAADERAGAAYFDKRGLIEYVRAFDAEGRRCV